MEKEPKNSDHCEALREQNNSNIFYEVYCETKAHFFHNSGYLKISYFTMFWLFVAGSVLGLAVETAFHALVYGGLESRAGLVWGPFSPIYGVGAVILTLFLNRFYHSHNLVIFLVAMVVGSVLEYITSWGMEFFWGAIAWDYSNTFGSIHGRTNFAFGMMWGLLGLVWVRTMLPLVKRAFSHINSKNTVIRIATVIVSLFMVANMVLTVFALDRESQRKQNIPATTYEQQLLDKYFPTSYLQSRMQNMSVYGKQ